MAYHSFIFRQCSCLRERGTSDGEEDISGESEAVMRRGEEGERQSPPHGSTRVYPSGGVPNARWQ